MKQGRCAQHARQADKARGTAHQRGYTGDHVTRFRQGVLNRDRTCVVCKARPSTVADHWPLSRRELVAQGLDPNDPARGRGTCHPCHSKATAATPDQRGGWHADRDSA